MKYKIFKWSILFIVLIGILCYLTSCNNEENLNIVETIKISSNRNFVHDSFEKLNNNSSIIIEGKVSNKIPQEIFITKYNEIHTKNIIEVSQCYKGDIKTGSTIIVAEKGGIISKYNFYKHENLAAKFGKKDKSILESWKKEYVLIAPENGELMKKNDNVILFLHDITDFFETNDNIYGILGSFEGKFYKNSNKNIVRKSNKQHDSKYNDLKFDSEESLKKKLQKFKQ